jgi:hypothetical protein
VLKCFLQFNINRTQGENNNINLYIIYRFKLQVLDVKFQRLLQLDHLGFLIPLFA